MPAGAPGWKAGLLLYLRGALMGIADVIPGVSGGTVALVVGVYERLLSGLSALFRVPVQFVRQGVAGGLRAVREVPWFFLVSLGLGIGSALLVGAHFIPGYYERWTMQANALFFGLILGSLAVPWHRILEPRRRHVLIAVGAAAVAFVLVSIPERVVEDPSFWLIIGGAMVAISAMVLPGVSGSYLLHVFGLWVPTLDAVNRMDVGYLAVFAIGLLIGAVFIVNLITWLLRHHHDTTLAVLVGLMVGALRALWPWVDDGGGLAVPGRGLAALIVPLLLIIAGFLFVRLIDNWARTRTPPRRIGAE